MTWLYWIPILLPAIVGAVLGICRVGRRSAAALSVAAVTVSLAASIAIAAVRPGSCVILQMTRALTRPGSWCSSMPLPTCMRTRTRAVSTAGCC